MSPKTMHYSPPPTPRLLLPQETGSWIVSYDINGVPFWTNTVSKAKTYHLFVEQTNNPAVSIVHAGTGQIFAWNPVLPNKPPPPPLKKKKSSVSDAGAGGSKWIEVNDSEDGAKSW